MNFMKRKSFFNLNINTALLRVLYGASVMAELSPMQGKLPTPSPYSLMDTIILMFINYYVAQTEWNRTSVLLLLFDELNI